MKVLFLSRYQKSTQRGAENFVVEISKRLATDYEVEIFSGQNADNLTKILKAHPDLVIPINGRIQSWKVSLGKLAGGFKVLITGHSGIGRDDLWNLAACRPDVFVALTEKMKEWAERWGKGVRVIKIPDGVDLKKFSPAGEKFKLNLPKPIILSVGALVWYKHNEKAIEAVSLMKNGSLVIVGKGPEAKKLEELGEEKLGDRFLLMSTDYQEIPKVYKAADIFTLPSWDREAFGMVYLEAMASGLPVVAPDDPSRKEIIGEAGVLVDVDDVPSYTKALEKALGINWGEKPRKQAEKFSWDIVAARYKETILEIVNRPR